jgi:adenylate cyclase
MKKPKKKEFNEKFIRFSLGEKLVTIITILILISFGAITFLVSKFVRQGLEISAKENNVELNRRAAAEAEQTFAQVSANSRLLIQVVNAAGADSALAKQAADFFFEQNNNIAAIFFHLPSKEKHTLLNDSFFFSWDVDASLADSYFEENPSAYLKAAAGEPVFFNAAPFFSTHLLALFFPLQEGEAFSVLYYPGNLNGSFSSQVNQSFIVNSAGDILVHADSKLVKAAANIANRDYIRRICASPLFSGQELYEEDGVKYFSAYNKFISGASIAVTTVRYSELFDGIDKAARFSLFFSAALLFISIFIVSNFTKSISVSLKALANAARKIEAGNFEIEIAPNGHDEIGYLTESFRRMGKALGVFGRFSNREIALKAMRGEIDTGAMQKNATVLFSGIRKFSEKLERFTNMFGREASEKIVFWLNNYFTQMTGCVVKTNGVAKFSGGALMAHWGTAYSAGSPAKDAFNCVKSALMMRKAVVLMNRNRRPDDPADSPLHIGCGINSGVVTAGQIGSDLNMEYTVIGSPVNLASKIEALNKRFGTDILISEDTWNLVRYFFLTEEMPPLTVKDSEKKVRIFAVINHVSVTTGPKTLAELKMLLGS